MTSEPRIVGVVLVRNEDLQIERVLRNVAEFCDVIHVADHGSADGTPAILSRLAAEFSHLEIRRIREPRESNDLLQPYVGTSTWIFGIDGDEIYDPAGLARFRPQLLAGAFDGWWAVFGNVLNCDEIAVDRQKASGYLAPPCRSMTKLYNFRMLRALDATAPQRLHSHKGADVFRPPYHADLRHELYKQLGWEEADFRCLHTCFLPRSSQDTTTARENVTESLQPARRLKRWLRSMVGLPTASDYKGDKYRRGSRVTVDATPFFP
ncbi:MAG TPA: glycosyltransferase family 2 protein [Chthoniobacteraceae bacterium]|jgi:glycosyltransferase involved in cell wall biosynthesis